MQKLAEVSIQKFFNSPFGRVSGGPDDRAVQGSFGDLVSLILKSSFVIAGVGLLFLLIFAGFSIIMAAGKSDPEQAAKGKKAATTAVIGFIIVFAAYWIVRIIELIFGVDFITSPGI